MRPRLYSSNAERQKAYRRRERPVEGTTLPPRIAAVPVAVLFANLRSHYKELAGLEVYDQQRDARTWPGGTAVIAHPPCAQWGRLRKQSTTNPEMKSHGPWAVSLVRKWGGILEHPAGSTLWPTCGLPKPGQTDEYGGFTLDVDQVIWGHPAQKHTWLYICGCRPERLPPIPAPGKRPTHCVTSSAPTFYRLPELSKVARELTPPDLCAWLVATARRCTPPTPERAADAAINGGGNL